VQPFPPTGAKCQVTTQTSSAPVWSRDGKQIFFAYTNRVFSADIKTASGLTAGQPVEYNTGSSLSSLANMRNFDVMPDGKRLLVVLPEGAATTDAVARDFQQIHVVLNWQSALGARERR